tara:strand:- start:201 stop:461 length:261 start_codon:yes stop_codon:yes gene_type:complete
MTNSITTFKTVQIITALNTINDKERNQEVLLDTGMIEMYLKEEEGTYDVYFTTFDKDCRYAGSSNTNSMSGDVSRMYDAIIKVINE